MYNIENEYKNHIFKHVKLQNSKYQKKSSGTLNTLHYYCFFIAKSDFYFHVKGIEYKILRNSITLIKPCTRILMSTNDKASANLYLLAFSSSFYDSYSKEDGLQKLHFYLNFLCPLLILPYTVYLQEMGEIIIKKLLLLKNTKNKHLYNQLLHNGIQALLLEVHGNFKSNLKFGKN